jgi:hypothetical protein
MAARLTELWAKAPQLETAPVSEKRVGLSRCPGCRTMGVEWPWGVRQYARSRVSVWRIGNFRDPNGVLGGQRMLRLAIPPLTGTSATHAVRAPGPRSGGQS